MNWWQKSWQEKEKYIIVNKTLKQKIWSTFTNSQIRLKITKPYLFIIWLSKSGISCKWFQTSTNNLCFAARDIKSSTLHDKRLVSFKTSLHFPKLFEEGCFVLVSFTHKIPFLYGYTPFYDLCKPSFPYNGLVQFRVSLCKNIETFIFIH